LVVVVTGAGPSVEPVCRALQEAGATVVAVADEADLGQAVAGLEVAGYVQMPTVLAAGDVNAADSLVEGVARFLSAGLLNRFRLAGVLLPRLAAGACVVLVGRQHPGTRHRGG